MRASQFGCDPTRFLNLHWGRDWLLVVAMTNAKGKKRKTSKLQAATCKRQPMLQKAVLIYDCCFVFLGAINIIAGYITGK